MNWNLDSSAMAAPFCVAASKQPSVKQAPKANGGFSPELDWSTLQSKNSQGLYGPVIFWGDDDEIRPWHLSKDEEGIVYLDDPELPEFDDSWE